MFRADLFAGEARERISVMHRFDQLCGVGKRHSFCCVAYSCSKRVAAVSRPYRVISIGVDGLVWFNGLVRLTSVIYDISLGEYFYILRASCNTDRLTLG